MLPVQGAAKAFVYSRRTRCNCAKTSSAPVNVNWRCNWLTHDPSNQYRDLVSFDGWRRDYTGSVERRRGGFAAPDVSADSTPKLLLNVMTNKSLAQFGVFAEPLILLAHPPGVEPGT